MTRKETMLVLIMLNDKMGEYMEKRYGTSTSHPELTASWLEKKFDRFYLVESTRHNEEDFSVEVELRYSLRSQEAFKYGKGHQVFYNRYLNTSAVNIKHLDNPEEYIKEIEAEMNA